MGAYGDITHRLTNTGLTEIVLEPDGTAKFGTKNDHVHVLRLNSPMKTCPVLAHGPLKESSTSKIVELRAYFAKFDTSGDRKLDFKEMSQALRVINAQISDDDLWVLFNEADRDNDGDVDFDEFVDYICKRPEEVREHF